MIVHSGPRPGPAIALAAALVLAPPVASAADDDPAISEPAQSKRPPRLPANRQPEFRSDGVGFVVGISGSEGFVLTNTTTDAARFSCRPIEVARVGNDHGPQATVVARDELNGLVLLRVSNIMALSSRTGSSSLKSAVFREEFGASYRETLIGTRSPRAPFSSGNGLNKVDIATSEIKGRLTMPGGRRLLNIETPNRSRRNGPVLDLSGNIVGMVTEGVVSNRKYRRMPVTRVGRERQFPWTVFAVGVDVIRAFLDAHGVRYRTAKLGAPCPRRNSPARRMNSP